MVARHSSDNEPGDWLEGDDAAPIPQVSEDLFHVPVTENASADEVARLRVEEIMRELEEELKRPEPKGAHARVEKEEGGDAPAEEHLAPASEEPAPAAKLVQTAEPMGVDDIDEPEMQDQDAVEESESFDDAEGASVESTLVLDRGKLGSSLLDREPADEDIDERKRERLRVNPNPQDAQRETGLSVVPKEKPRRRFGFFAAIGEFVARLLHLDDR